MKKTYIQGHNRKFNNSLFTVTRGNTLPSLNTCNFQKPT